MTRKDFQLIADAIRETREMFGENPPMDRLVHEMGTALYGTNPRFDRGRFEAACKPREFPSPHDALKYHVTGAIIRGEGEAVIEVPVK